MLAIVLRWSISPGLAGMSVTSMEVILTLCSPLTVSGRFVTRMTHSDDWVTCTIDDHRHAVHLLETLLVGFLQMCSGSSYQHVVVRKEATATAMGECKFARLQQKDFRASAALAHIGDMLKPGNTIWVAAAQKAPMIRLLVTLMGQCCNI